MDLTYGVRSIGMKYERMLFGMKISDASCLAKSIQSTDTLASLVLQVCITYHVSPTHPKIEKERVVFGATRMIKA